MDNWVGNLVLTSGWFVGSFLDANGWMDGWMDRWLELFTSATLLYFTVEPSYVTPPPADIVQDVSTTVIIPCVANGLPSPTVRWYRNGIHIDSDVNNRYFYIIPALIHMREWYCEYICSSCIKVFFVTYTYELVSSYLVIIFFPIFRYLVLSSGNLQISSAESDDSGMFQCFVTNEAGEINRATWVRVRSK